MNVKIILNIVLVCLVIYIIYKLYRIYIKMNISSKGIDFLTALEGKRNKMYLDSKGLPTIGVGHLIKKGEEYLNTKVLTDKEVLDLFKKDLKEFEDAANDAIYVPVSQNEFDAVVSILFNIGKGYGDGIGSESTFINYINQRKPKKDIVKAIMRFKYPEEIIGRRAKEARLFEKGNYSNMLTQQEKEYYLYG